MWFIEPLNFNKKHINKKLSSISIHPDTRAWKMLIYIYIQFTNFYKLKKFQFQLTN